jgi:hypothetical protein
MWEGSEVEENGPAGIVDDFLDDAPDVPFPFCEIEGAQTGGALVVVGVCFKLVSRVRILVGERTERHVRWRAIAFVP